MLFFLFQKETKKKKKNNQIKMIEDSILSIYFKQTLLCAVHTQTHMYIWICIGVWCGHLIFKAMSPKPVFFSSTAFQSSAFRFRFFVRMLYIYLFKAFPPHEMNVDYLHGLELWDNKTVCVRACFMLKHQQSTLNI